MLRLALGTLPVMLLILATALSLGGYLAFAAVRGAYTTSTESRFDVIADQLVAGIETAAALGIGVPEQVSLPDRLGDQAASDALIRSIAVVDPGGSVLFSGGSAPEETAGLATREQPILNDFGAPVATLVIYYDASSIEERIDELRGTVLFSAGLAVAGGGVTVALAIFLILAGLQRRARLYAEASGEDAFATPLALAAEELSRLEVPQAADRKHASPSSARQPYPSGTKDS